MLGRERGKSVLLQFWNSKIAILVLCLFADNVPERLQETDDEGIERDSGEGDDESNSSPHHVTLSKVIEVSIMIMSSIIVFSLYNSIWKKCQVKIDASSHMQLIQRESYRPTTSSLECFL